MSASPPVAIVLEKTSFAFLATAISVDLAPIDTIKDVLPIGARDLVSAISSVSTPTTESPARESTFMYFSTKTRGAATTKTKTSGGWVFSRRSKIMCWKIASFIGIGIISSACHFTADAIS